MLQTSEQVDALMAALATAQANIKGALKDSENPFFRSRYADLASIWDACRGPLTAQGLAVVQSPSTQFTGEPEVYTYKSRAGEERSGVRIATTVQVVTRLCHSSGQWIEGVSAAMLPSADPQAVGSAITYLRRYSLAAMVGVAPEEDDGEATTRPVHRTPKAVPQQSLELGRLRELLGHDAFTAADRDLMEKWLAKPRKGPELLDAIARAEDKIEAAKGAEVSV